MKPMPDHNLLLEILNYNSATGIFTWKKSPKKGWIGKQTGVKPDNKGYHIIRISNVNYKAHRLAYYYVTGIDPLNNQIDHINLNKSDNSFCNLRLAQNGTNKHNAPKYKNNKSGLKGIWWNKKLRKWQVGIQVNLKNIHLGVYSNKIYAALVYARAAKKHFGEFYRIR